MDGLELKWTVRGGNSERSICIKVDDKCCWSCTKLDGPKRLKVEGPLIQNWTVSVKEKWTVHLKMARKIKSYLEPDHVISDHNICHNLKVAYGCPFVQIGLEKLSSCHTVMLILIKINTDLKI